MDTHPLWVIGVVLFGLLAGLLATLATNGSLELLGLVAFLARRPVPTVGATLAEARELSTVLPLLLAWPGFFLLVIVLGTGVALLIRRGVPAPVALLLWTLVLLLVALLIVGPVVGRSDARIARDSGAILIGVEVVRWLAYGAALAYLGPLTARLRRDTIP